MHFRERPLEPPPYPHTRHSSHWHTQSVSSIQPPTTERVACWRGVGGRNMSYQAWHVIMTHGSNRVPTGLEPWDTGFQHQTLTCIRSFIQAHTLDHSNVINMLDGSINRFSQCFCLFLRVTKSSRIDMCLTMSSVCMPRCSLLLMCWPLGCYEWLMLKDETRC